MRDNRKPLTADKAVDLLSAILQGIDDETLEYEAMVVLRRHATRVMGKEIKRLNTCFDSDFRHSATPKHLLVYSFVDTVAANFCEESRESSPDMRLLHDEAAR